MNTPLSTQDKTTSAPTAAVILIGNELLSGRTQDINLQYIASKLVEHGITLRETRIIPDDEAVVVEAVNSLRKAYDYVFTTGGIGPTHDDITADCIASAFGVALPIHPLAEQLLLAYFKERDIQPNEDRLRMARIPEGGKLIDNPVSAAPGFNIGNVFVMAGVPRIMQAMFDSILPSLRKGPAIQSVSVTCNLGEGTLAAPLRELQAKYPMLDLGSYPGKFEGVSRVMLVARGTDVDAMSQIEDALKSLITTLGGVIEKTI
ncbi:MAG: competence/damage-inducible protein A [Granulosicoccaceae bacterium]